MRKRFGIHAALILVVSVTVGFSAPLGAQSTQKTPPPKTAQPAPKTQPSQPPPEQRAGEVSAEIPRGQIARQAQTVPLAVGAGVFWNDIIQTADKGRVRITLLDATILNIGPSATFRVVIHNEKTGESELYLMAGKVRARVKKAATKQKFAIKTDAAVLGVIGTDFFVEADSEETTALVYEGVVRVRSSDPDIAGVQVVNAGQKLTIRRGEPPPLPVPATPQELEESLRDTDVGAPLPPPPSLPAQTQPPATPAAAPAAGGEAWKSGWQVYAQGFSADQVITQGSQRHRMKMYVRQNAMRMDMEEQGQRMTSILRSDRGVMWTLMHDQRMYMEMPLGGMPGRGADSGFMEAMKESGAKSETEMLGIEQVGGYQCQKYRYRTTHNGQTYSGTVWAALALNGFPIKMVDDKSGTVVEYENIRLGPPDASLFELPSGYQKMNMGAPH